MRPHVAAYHFGEYVLDPEEHRLSRNGEEIALRPKNFEVLCCLLENEGHLLSKEALLNCVWKDVFVTEQVLTQSISEIRAALDDDGEEPRFIKTSPKVGYKFVGQVQTIPSQEADLDGRATSPPAQAHNEPKPSRWLAAATLVVVCIGLIATWWYLSWQTPAEQPLKIIPLTAEPGFQGRPCFSPDGEHVAFVWQVSDDKTDIYVRRVDGRGSLQLTDHPGRDFNPTWSPLGGQIAFWRHFQGTSEIRTVSPLGGGERRLATAQSGRAFGNRGLSWSPDGKLLAYTDQASANEPTSIFLLSTRTGEKLKLTTPSDTREPVGHYSPVFSPDGQYLAFWQSKRSGYEGLVVFPRGEGEPKEILLEILAHGFAWTQDGKEIVYAATPQDVPTYSSRLCRISIFGGDPRWIDAAGEGVGDVAISPQGDRLTYVKESWDLNIAKVEVSADDNEITSVSDFIASTRVDANPHISPDGTKIAFSSARSGPEEVWICDSDGSDPIRLTYFEANDTSGPCWSPDGQSIAFCSNQPGNFEIYAMDSQGGSPRRLTSDPSSDIMPIWSRDGKWVYFCSNRSGAPQVWKVPAGGGLPVQITNHGGLIAEESPDGRFLYYSKRPDQLWRMSLEGGEETLLLEDVYTQGWAMTADGIYLFRITKPHPSIQFFSFATGEVNLVRDVTEDLYTIGNRWMSVAPGGNWLLYTVQEIEGDIMVLENFR